MKEMIAKKMDLPESTLPCPFCHKLPELYDCSDIYPDRQDKAHPIMVMTCMTPDCLMRPHTRKLKSVDEVVSEWNTRVTNGNKESCPFCGNTLRTVNLLGDYAIVCTSKECKIHPRTKTYPSETDLMNAFNKKEEITNE